MDGYGCIWTDIGPPIGPDVGHISITYAGLGGQPVSVVPSMSHSTHFPHLCCCIQPHECPRVIQAQAVPARHAGSTGIEYQEGMQIIMSKSQRGRQAILHHTGRQAGRQEI